MYIFNHKYFFMSVWYVYINENEACFWEILRIFIIDHAHKINLKHAIIFQFNFNTLDNVTYIKKYLEINILKYAI